MSLTSYNSVNNIHNLIMQEIDSYPCEGTLSHLDEDREFLLCIEHILGYFVRLASVVIWKEDTTIAIYQEMGKLLRQMASKGYTFPIFRTIAQYLLGELNSGRFKMKPEDRFELYEFRSAIHVEFARKLYSILTFYGIPMLVNTQQRFQKNKALIIQLTRLVTIWEDMCHCRNIEEEKTTGAELLARLSDNVDISDKDVEILRGFCMNLIMNYLSHSRELFEELQKPGTTVDPSILDEWSSRLYRRYDPKRLPAPLKKEIQRILAGLETS